MMSETPGAAGVETPIVREERIGNARLILGDCRAILPTLGRVDAIISDPPYGQKQNTNVIGAKGLRTYRCGAEGGGSRVIDGNAKARTTAKGIHSTRLATRFPDAIAGDDLPFDPDLILGASDRVLVWGAHRFADRLPTGSWLVWDKVPTGKVRDQGDGEAAWLNDDPPRPLRIFRLLWDGVCVGSAARHEVTSGQSRVHPTQKPVVLMAWCIQQARLPIGASICDPYMGAGSTGVAAIEAGHPFVGIELEAQYFETALRRIEAAQRQSDLFVSAPIPEPPEDARFADLFAEPGAV